MNKLIVGISVLALIVGGIAFFRPSTTTVVNQPIGHAGSDYLSFTQFLAGVKYGGQVSTTTQGSATLTAAEFKGWSESSMVSLLPNLTAALTITLPASSTVSNIVPNPGDRQTFCVRNATTTANIYMTLAGGTGINLVAASSSATALGSKVLLSGKVGCITLVREAKTSTTYDIDALLTVFQ